MVMIVVYENASNMTDCPESGTTPLTIRLVLAWPDKALTPNAKRRSYWSKYRKIAAAYRAACFWDAKQALGRNRFTAPPQIAIEFHPPDLRHRDDDGMIGAFKNGRDGVAAAIGFDDRHWRPAYTFHAPHRPDGRVVMVLTQEGGLNLNPTNEQAAQVLKHRRGPNRNAHNEGCTNG